MNSARRTRSSSGSEYRADLQALRGIAILAVLLFHFNEDFFTLGYLGVDIFFVLSGFVVTPLILKIFIPNTNKRVSSGLKHFFLNRIFRLLPALCVSLLFSGILILLFGNLSDHQKAARQGISTLLLLGNLGAYRYSGEYFSPNPNPFVHTWSLSVEEQIYIALPIIMLLVYWRYKEVEKIALTIFLLVTIISFTFFVSPNILESAYSKFGFTESATINFYSAVSRCWQFTLGGIGYLIHKRSQYPIIKLSKIKNTLLIWVPSTIFVFLNSKYLILNSIFITIITFAGILFRSLESLPESLSKILNWLGDRSYSIYLYHMPLLYLAKYSAFFDSTPLTHHFLPLVAVIVSLMLGSVSYINIENRFRLPRVRRNERSQTLFLILSFFLLPMGLFLVIDQGSLNRYWGMDRSLERPLYAGDLDKNCVRQNDKSLGEPCVYGSDSAKKTILLVGDSHATHFSQALIDSVNTYSWKVAIWTRGHCPIQFTPKVIGDATSQCFAHNLKMLEWVKVNKPSSIVVSQYVKQSSSQSELRIGLKLLKNNSENVLLILNTPVFPDVNDFMVSRPLVMKPYNPPRQFSIQRMNRSGMIESASLGHWAQNNGIKTLDFTTLFCNQDTCSRFANGKWLYWDDDHLSIYGAALAEANLRDYFRGLGEVSLRNR